VRLGGGLDVVFVIKKVEEVCVGVDFKLVWLWIGDELG